MGAAFSHLANVSEWMGPPVGTFELTFTTFDIIFFKRAKVNCSICSSAATMSWRRPLVTSIILVLMCCLKGNMKNNVKLLCNLYDLSIVSVTRDAEEIFRLLT